MGLLEFIGEDYSKGSLTLLSRNEKATAGFGYLLARHLQPGGIISLDGDLGAGKTVLTRGIASGLGCRGLVSSPTFTLLMEHPACLDGTTLYHFDAYRLRGAADFTAAGLDEYFDFGGICVVEWGNRIAEVLPDRTMIIVILRTDPGLPDDRCIRISWPGEPDRLASLAAALKETVRHQDEGTQGDRAC